MIYHIHPVAKSPTQERCRIGPKHLQDWYRSLVLAKALLRKKIEGGFEAYIIIVTGFQMKDCRAEADIFHEELLLLGVPDRYIIVVKDGYHTGDQVQIAERYTKENGGRHVSISVWSHFLHVKYYSHPETEHRMASGLPNLKEVLKDSFMPMVAWVIDRRSEWRQAFEEWVIRRRKAGNL